MNHWLAFARHALRHPHALLPGAPRGVINSARHWVEEQQRLCPADIRRGPVAERWEFDPPGLVSLPPPHCVQTERRRALRVFPVPATELYFLKGARLLGLDGVVLSPDNRVFAEFTYVDEPGGIGAHSIFRRRRFPPVERLGGWYATLCYPSAWAYYHWLTESLPRLRLLEPHLSALDGIFVPENLTDSMRQSLMLLGVQPGQLVPMGMRSHFQPEHLLVPRYCAGLDLPAWVPDYLRARVLGSGLREPGTRRLYVSRAGTARRRVLNEEQVARLAHAHGFESVRPETLDFEAQARLFASASVVLGASGAALTNAMFCAPGATLITLQPHGGMAPHSFYSLASAAGLRYWDLTCHPSLPPGVSLDEHVDFSVDLALLEQTIREVDAERGVK